MRWDALFDDMEAQFAAGDRLELESEVSERARVDAASIDLADRLRGSLGRRIGVHLASGSTFEGTLSHAGADALVLNEELHQVLIPYASAARYVGLGRFSIGEPSQVRRTLGLARELRGLARDRSGLTVLLARGSAGEAAFTGVIDRVGRDFFDLAMTQPGEVRRSGNVSQISTVPFGALAALRSLRSGDLQ
ncbi:hypothetical protein [Pseudarthrobacter sp. N5]|uniref:hypothetical protein n=1 Tax=Pseudarthrobacter sp. N5 TaxID=3418416 RepID=UPI003CFB6D33